MARPRNGQRPPTRFPDRKKVCPACETEKPWRDFYPLTRWPDGLVKSVRSKCKLCESAIAQARWREQVAAADREAFLAERRRYYHERRAIDPGFVANLRLHSREYTRWRYWNDPEFRAQNIARSVAFNRSARGRALQQRRRARARRERQREPNVQLESRPWQEWLLEFRREFETTTDLARHIGFDEATVRRWLDGGEGVTLDRADRVLTHIGEPGLLMVLWPGLYDFNEEAAA